MGHGRLDLAAARVVTPPARPLHPARLFRRALVLASNSDPVPVSRVRRRLEQAAEAGHAKATWALGNWAHHGIGEPVRPAKALRLWRKAASLGDEEARYDLATTYAHRGGTRNERIAFAWYQQAGRGGDVPAMAELSC
jgi:hypothetical protein